MYAGPGEPSKARPRTGWPMLSPRVTNVKVTHWQKQAERKIVKTKERGRPVEDMTTVGEL